MKIDLPRLLVGLAVFTLLVSLTSSGLAQESPAKEQPTLEKKALPMPELAASELNPEYTHPTVPRECAGLRPDVQTHRRGSGALVSPGLTSLLNSRHLQHKSYGDPRINTVFADSFKLRCCKVCYATLEVVVKHGPGVYSAGAANFSNDTITVGVAPFGDGPPTRFFTAPIWSATTPNPKTLKYVLGPPAAWDKIDCSARPPAAYLDILVQDDTEVVSATLSVWYY